jgi:murein DD-endopeptidase MepM/ murein hydrolase activator NlpD
MNRVGIYGIFLCICMLPFFVILFVFEYYSLQKTAYHLRELTEAYQRRICMLDDIIDHTILCSHCEMYTHSLHEGSDIPLPSVWLNRDPLYLKNSMNRFLQSQKLENILSSIEKEYISKSNSTSLKKQSVKKAVAQKARTIKRPARKATNALLQWPIQSDKFWISSVYGPRKKHNGAMGFHYGIDLAAIKGTPVMAAAGGVVVSARYDGGFGNAVIILHNNRVSTRYAHMNSVCVRSGQRVYPGSMIGKVGVTGHIRKKTKDGSHLHLEVIEYGRRVNPLHFLPLLS